MSKVFFEDSSMRLLERSLDLSAERQNLISNNLANVDTPGYKTVDLQPEDELKLSLESPQALKLTNARHISVGVDGRLGATAIEVEGLPQRNDLNNVNIDREMAQVSTNAMRFSMVAQLLAGKFRGLKNAITEGR